MSIREQFVNPPAAFRGKPFWAWNGPLVEDELRRQIRVFKQMGLGGAFMHSRVGLATPYLSEEWFRLINACADEAQKQNMEAWLYDEDRWPSGAAGGLVTRDERYRMRYLRMDVLDAADFQPEEDDLAVFEARIDGVNASAVCRLSGGAAPSPGAKVLAFRVRLTDPSPWYNDQTYLDTLNPEAVRRFIEVTHAAYAKHTLNRYPNTIVPGIFTDEPNYGHAGQKVSDAEMRTAWTDGLPAAFRERHGYDILDHLPELFYRVEGAEFSKARRDYYDCLAFLFTDSFARQIGEWCDENGQLFTGHVLAEENLLSQATVVGSAMRSYPYMQAPGIDILSGEGLERVGGKPMEISTAKQCHSVAHQFGRKWMLSELYGCTGWHFTFAEHKAVGDWQAALGVNLRCQHLAWYTGLGEAKRDYPASISFQSSWFADYPLVENYFARVGLALSEGEPVRDVAVIHPIESCWGVFVPGAHDEARKLNEQFMAVQGLLLEEHFDFDYVDEDILDGHGAIEDDTLRVEKARYRVVVVPPMLTMRESTRKALADFAASGGKVVFVEPVAARVDSEPSGAVGTLAAKAVRVPVDRAALSEALLATGRVRRASIASENGEQVRPAIYMLRQDEATGRSVVFVCYMRQETASGPVTIQLPVHGQVQEWDAVTGEIYLADAMDTTEGVVIETDLPAYGSRLFVIDPEPDRTLSPRPEWEELNRRSIEQAQWPIRRDAPNAFPLDWPEYAIDGAWQPADEVLRVDRKVRDAAGLRHRGGGMVQPWAQTTPPSARTVALSLRYRFDVETKPQVDCSLVMELSERFQIRLNGQPLAVPEQPETWIDNSFRVIPVPAGMLRQGENEVLLDTQYGATHGLECVYFTGDFGVEWRNRRATITAAPTALALGDWTDQGLPCYTDGIAYQTEFNATAVPGERTFIELPDWKGVLVKVRVNGQEMGKVAWPPCEVDVTEGILEGTNRLEIEVVSSRRNLLGPLHCADVYPGWTGPGEFVTSGERWTDDYVRIPYGLMQPPVISTRVAR